MIRLLPNSLLSVKGSSPLAGRRAVIAAIMQGIEHDESHVCQSPVSASYSSFPAGGENLHYDNVKIASFGTNEQIVGSSPRLL